MDHLIRSQAHLPLGHNTFRVFFASSLSYYSLNTLNTFFASFQVWDVRADQVVRSIHGPYICGDGIDIWEDSVLTASWLAHDALQVLLVQKGTATIAG